MKTINKSKKKIAIILSLVIAIFMTSTIITVADEARPTNTGSSANGDKYIDWYMNNADMMHTHSLFSDVIRSMEWGITKTGTWIANTGNKIYDTAFNFIDWTQNEKVEKMVKKFKPVLIALMALSILYLGIVMIMQHEKKPNFAHNIVIVILVVTCSTAMFSNLNEWTKQLKTGIDTIGDTQEVESAYDTVNSNLVDLVAVDRENNQGLKAVNYNNRNKPDSGKIMGLAGINNKKKFSMIDYNETLNFEDNTYNLKSETSDILRYKLGSDGKGNGKTKELETGMFGIGDEYYYRYNLDFFTCILELFSLALIYIAMAYKCVRVIFELIVSRVLVFLYSAEISGGEKVKKILIFIRDSYILLLVSALCIRIYLLMNAFLPNHVTGLTKGIILLFIAFSVIDGPNLVEKLLGMDAGLKSSTARFISAYHMARGAGRVATGVAGKTGGKIKTGIDAAKGKDTNGQTGGFIGKAAGAAYKKGQKANTAIFGQKTEGGTREGSIIDKISDKIDENSNKEYATVIDPKTGKEHLEKQNMNTSNLSKENTSTVDKEGNQNPKDYHGSAFPDGKKANEKPNPDFMKNAGASAGAKEINAIKGDKGDKGDRGFKGEEGARIFSESSQKLNTDTSLPERKTTSSSNYINKKDGDK